MESPRVNPSAPPKLPRAVPSPLAVLRGFPLRNKAIFLRQLSTMISSAMPLDSAVQTAGIATFPSLTREMARHLNAGYPLSQVMARYPHYFSDYEISVVHAGEYGGSLDTQLEILAEELERAYRLQQMVKSKLAYPAFIAHCAVFIPTLPLLVTSGASRYLHATLGVLVPVYLVVLLTWLCYRLTAQASWVRGAIDGMLLWVPLFGGTLKALASTRLMRTLGHLYDAGIMPGQAVEIAANTCGNASVGARLRGAWRALGDEQRLSAVLTRSGLFSPMILSMVSSGEEAGTVPTLMAKAADFMEQELQQKVSTMMAVFPVLLLLGVGAVVGYIVINYFSNLTKLLNL